MDDEDQVPTDTQDDAPGPVSEGIETKPRGNPEVDEEAVEKGEESLGRVKPY